MLQVINIPSLSGIKHKTNQLYTYHLYWIFSKFENIYKEWLWTMLGVLNQEMFSSDKILSSEELKYVFRMHDFFSSDYFFIWDMPPSCPYFPRKLSTIWVFASFSGPLKHFEVQSILFIYFNVQWLISDTVK